MRQKVDLSEGLPEPFQSVRQPEKAFSAQSICDEWDQQHCKASLSPTPVILQFEAYDFYILSTTNVWIKGCCH